MATSHLRRVEKESQQAKARFAPVVFALVVGLILGVAGDHLLFGGLIDQFFGGSPAAATSLKESDLDRTMATYVAGGKAGKVTYRDAILEHGSLEAAQNDDGTYRIPSADSALAVARGRILTAEAERLGITIGDTEVDAYALATFGSTDLETIANAYGMSQDGAAALLKEAALMSALRDQVVGTGTVEAPQPPAEPSEGEEVSMIPEYATYIIGLAGDEWDASAQRWASEDGPYAQALSDYQVTADGATYEAARQAYFVAYQAHIAEQSAYAAQWTDYVNGLLGKASIEVSTLAL